MVWEVTYRDANGNPLLTATFNADSPKEMLARVATVPSLEPPAGTASVDVRIVPT